MAPPLALTMGEPAGIGGEITLKAWRRLSGPAKEGGPSFFLIDDADRLAGLARDLEFAVPVRPIAAPEEAPAIFPDALPVLSQPLARPSVPGRLDPENAPAVVAAIDRAVALVRAGRARAVVTNPIHKRCLYEAGFHHPGHTEYLAALAGPGTTPVMMLACPALRVVPLTVHMPLRDVPGSLTVDSIVRQARIVAEALRRDFGIAEPRLALAGLNPHAGEGGRLGDEEERIIAPALDRLRADGIRAAGPLSADTMFHERARLAYDAALCMYHDQALIPLKTLDFDGGVNVTLGLPFVRTSPDHGTALGIAGTGQALETSLVAALRLADDMARHRAEADG